MLPITIIFMSSLVLTGCSREPSQEELHALYQEQIKQTNELATRIMQQDGEIMKVTRFEKLDCNKVDKSKDLNCRINVTVEMPFLGAQTNTADLRVAKGESGWVLVD
uniref:hypothetical protein n=1 Tax=uncultured Acinetobacter sp. TaxID=165433 RepID=UPI002619E798|nr:hypothetical protein [uncultured Acinetobacter sp.]